MYKNVTVIHIIVYVSVRIRRFKAEIGKTGFSGRQHLSLNMLHIRKKARKIILTSFETKINKNLFQFSTPSHCTCFLNQIKTI